MGELDHFSISGNRIGFRVSGGGGGANGAATIWDCWMVGYAYVDDNSFTLNTPT